MPLLQCTICHAIIEWESQICELPSQHLHPLLAFVPSSECNWLFRGHEDYQTSLDIEGATQPPQLQIGNL